MEKKELRVLFKSLTIEEKISQTLQLNGNLLVENDVMTTGPAADLGLPPNLNLYEIGAIYNVNDYSKLKKIQERVLSESRHKIPLLFMSDIIYGFRTIFPIPLAQAGSYDFDLIEKAACISAKESYRNGIHVVFSPMLDIVRDPRWGRVMESPGEDVYTAENFAKAMIKGYQGTNPNYFPREKVAACIKHFAAYGAPESGREYNSVELSTQKLLNEYLVPYQAAIEAGCALVMTAFNLLNGIPATGNKWLNRSILRNKYGFNGVLVSDYAAISELINHGYASDRLDAARKALTAGVDLDMMTSVYVNGLPELVKNDIYLKLLDEATMRILKLKNKLGLFENPYRGLDELDTGRILNKEDRSVAVEMVEKSCVLLKNNASTLPIGRDKKIAVIGPYGESQLTLGFWGSVSGRSIDTITLKQGLLSKFSKNNLLFSKGYNLFNTYDSFGISKSILEKLNGPIESEDNLLNDAVAKSYDADVIIITIGENFMESGEGASKAHLGLPENQKRLIKNLKKQGKPLVGLIYTGRPLVLTDIEDYFESLLLVWFPGTMGGVGIANILSGDTNPSAKLTMSFPRSEGQLPIYYARTPTGRPTGNSSHSERFISKYIDESNLPLFAFGSGLSYSKVTADWIGPGHVDDDCVTAQIKIFNDSDIWAPVVAQIYVKQKPAKIVQPVRRLVKSYRIDLEPKDEKFIDFILEKTKLKYFDNVGVSHLELGNYEFVLNVLGKEHILAVNIQ